MPGCPERVLSGHCRQHAAQRERQRPNGAIRKLYATARWKRLRQWVLATQPVCADCTVAPAGDVHHAVAHRGDEARFWSGPFVGLCHDCHSTRTRAGE